MLTGVSIGGGTHNVVYVATENDSVYALDANTGAQYWKVSLINPAGGITAPTSSEIGCSDITPEYGISSTPVISISAGTIYVVANTLENGTYYYRLHALNIQNGVERTGSPVVIQDSGGVFNAKYQNQRTGLLLDNGHVLFGFSSHCDNNTWYGWVFSYNATTLARENVFLPVSAASGGQGGVWMGEDGLAADSAGNIFFASGNGNFNGGSSFGDSIVKLPQPPTSGSWTPLDWYTPGDEAQLNGSDLDLGSGGVLLLPDLPSGTSHYQRLVQAGKNGTISIVDRNSMGHFCCSPNGPDTNIVEEISGQISGEMFGSPSYWNGRIFFGGIGDHVKAFSFNTSTGAVSTTPVAATSASFGGSGHFSATTSVSSNGSTNGIVWALDSGTGVLHAFDPNSLIEFYNSAQAPGSRDLLNGGIKFLAPTIANGKVYVGSNGQLGIYGVDAAVSPTSVNFGSFTNSSSRPKSQTVTITNTGASALTVSSISLLGTNPLFYLNYGSCLATLALNASCSLTVTFDPSNAGSGNSGLNTNTLQIVDGIPTSPQEIPLTATMTCQPSQCSK